MSNQTIVSEFQFRLMGIGTDLGKKQDMHLRSSFTGISIGNRLLSVFFGKF